MSTNWICLRPWARLEIIEYGNSFAASSCCQSWLKNNQILPRITSKEDLMSVWNGQFLQDFRASILDGSYRFCDTKKCPFYMTSANFERIKPDEEQKIIVDRGPIKIAYSADRACNLKCRSCRNNFVHRSGKGFELFLSCINSNDDVIELEMLCSGEVFFSKDTLNFLRSFRKERYPTIQNIFLITNGTLLTRAMWESLGEARDVVKEISVSVDAYSEKIYSMIRGDHFKPLVENLNFLSDLKKTGQLSLFALSFVVQSYNMHEINDFCLWAKSLGVNSLCVAKILNWGHLKKDDPMFLKEDDPIYLNQLNLFKKFVEENPSIRFITNLFSKNV